MCQGHRIFLSVRGRPRYRVKQAAPGNYPARCFVQRSVRLLHFTHAHETNDALGHRGSRPLTTICGRPRAERNRARFFGFDPKRLPSNSRRCRRSLRSPAFLFLVSLTMHSLIAGGGLDRTERKSPRSCRSKPQSPTPPSVFQSGATT
jgi:hypothetical protein